MNVLIVGDEHTYGYGLLSKSRNYVEHLVWQLGRTGQSVFIETYAHLTLSQAKSVLAQLPLSRYDLIVFQLDTHLLETVRPKGEVEFWMPVVPSPQSSGGQSGSFRQRMMKRIEAMGTLLNFHFNPGPKRALLQLLSQLRLYRHNVLLLTPLPHRQGTSQWLQNRMRALVLREGERQAFSVFDTSAVIQPREEYFLPDYPEHLNAVAHELLGRSLFDFYQSAPTIITVQTPNRNQLDY